MAGRTLTQRIALDGGKEIERELKKLGRTGELAFRKLQTEAKKLRGPGGAFFSSLRRANRALRNAAVKAQGLSTKLTSLGRAGAFRITLPAILGLGAGVKIVASYEKSLLQLQAQAGLTAGQMGKIEEEITRLGLATSKSTTDIAQAAKELNRAGVPAEDLADGFLAAAVKLAEAGEVTTVEAGKRLQLIMLQFKLSLEDAETIIQQTIGGALSTQFNFDEFTDAMLKAGGGAAKFGFSLQEVAAAGVVLAPLFSDAAKLGTALRNVFNRFGFQGKEGKQILNELSLSFTDLEEVATAAGGKISTDWKKFKAVLASDPGNDLEKQKAQFADLNTIMERMNKRLLVLGKPELANKLGKIFAQENIAAFVTLAEAGADGLERAMDRINAVPVDAIAAANIAGLSGALGLLKGTIDTFLTTNKEALRPITELVLEINTFVQGLVKADPAMKKWVAGIIIAAAAVGPLLLALGAIGFAISSMVVFFSLWTIPIIAVGAAILAIVLYWDDVKAAAVATWEAIKTGAGFVIDLLDSFLSTFIDDWEGLRTVVPEIWEAIQDAAGAALDFITDLWNTLVESFTGKDLEILKSIWAVFSDAFEIAGAIIKRFWTAVVNDIMVSVRGIIAIVKEAINFFKRLNSEKQRAEDKRVSNQIADDVIGGATGGYVRGAGTTTSDSILARLSDKEFIMQAKSVGHYGVGFMHALNKMRLPKNFLKGFASGGLVKRGANAAPLAMQRFNAGGLVHAMNRVNVSVPQIKLPRMAAGGPVEAQTPSGQPLTLVLDGASLAGTFTPDDTAESLDRFMIRKAGRRAGSNPGWL